MSYGSAKVSSGSTPSESSGLGGGHMCPMPDTVCSTDLLAAMTHSGAIESMDYHPDDFDNCTPHARVLSGGGVDDFGVIGGVAFANNVSCPNGVITSIDNDTDVAFSRVGNKLVVDWSAVSDPTCGPPTGLQNVCIEFYWT